MPKKDKNDQEGPDIRSSLIKVNIDGDTVFVDSNQYKPQVDHAKKLLKQKAMPKNPKPQEWKSEEHSLHKIADGQPYTQDLEDKIIEDMSQPYVQGLTLLGGEPFLNTWVCLKIINRVRKEFGHTKDIWSWSGYTWDELQKETPDKKETIVI